MRVLDGGIVILDASAGVEAQTVTVWRQAKRYKVPTIAFLNKMDKPNADLTASLDSMVKKLQVEPLLLNLPITKNQGDSGKFCGVVDLVEMRSLIWDEDNSAPSYGKEFTVGPVEGDLKAAAAQARTALIDKLCDYDEILADAVLKEESYDLISAKSVKDALRRVIVSSTHDQNSILVTLCGSAYKNIGVQPLMDAIVNYLPSPEDKEYPFLSCYPQNSLCGLAFKVVHHPQKGALTFVRVYAGELQEGAIIYNLTRGVSEKASRLMVAFADDFKSVSSVGEGNIAVIAGLKETVTGDTLTASSTSAQKIMKKWEEKGPEKDLACSPHLLGISVPNPVFYCSIEPPSVLYQKKLEVALKNLTREDPSLHVSSDKDTAQTVLSGMGELHLEIVRDRIHREYKVEAELGKLLIAYREAVDAEAFEATRFERSIIGKFYDITVTMSVRPLLHEETRKLIKPRLAMAKDFVNTPKPLHLKEVFRGFESAVATGPLLGYPVVNSQFLLHSLEVSPGTPASLISSAAISATNRTLQAAGVKLMEPLMLLEIVTAAELVNKVTQDLLRRRGEVLSSDDRGGSVNDGSTRVITARAPLADLRGYSRRLRTMTSGRASLGMELERYQVMEESDQNKAIEEVTGFAP